MADFNPPLDFTADLGSFFAQYWGGPKRSQQIVDELKGAFGNDPVLIFGGFTPLDPRSGESDYTVKTIHGVRPTAGQPLFVTIFLWDKMVGAFDQLAWFTFHISFVAR